MIGLAIAAGLKLRAAGKALGDAINTPIGRRVVLALVVLVAGWGYGEWRFSAGVNHEKAAEAARLAAGRKVVTKVAGQSAAISTDVRQKLHAKTAEIRWRTKTLKEEVPVYVPFEVDRAVVVPVGFVRLHDAAALGTALPSAPD